MSATVPTPPPLRTGARVVLRHRLPPGSSPSMTDVVGVVTAVDASSVTIDTSRGPVTVARDVVAAVREVPPRPLRPGPAHLTTGVEELGALMARGWPAVETAALGGWLLRASSGFTGRGNSVLPYGDPGVPTTQAVDRAERWYGERGLPTRFHLDLPAEPSDAPAPSPPPESLLDEAHLTGIVRGHPLGAVLVRRGYRAGQPTLVLTGASAAVPPARPGAGAVHLDDRLTPDWLATYARQRTVVPGVTQQVLTGSPGQLFASTGEPGRLTAVARLSVHPGWAGIHSVWVDPAHRRRGLSLALMSALAGLAAEHAMGSVVLQVEAGNVAARALYTGLGFGTHHAYCYLDAPA